MPKETDATDLLGDPLRPLPDKRGRRKLRFPAETYEKVEVMSAAGMGQDDIADIIGISAPSLRKYFRPELAKALARQKGEALSLLAAAARKGNVSAIKAYMLELDKRGAAAALKEREQAPSRRSAPARKGKREERQDAAADVVSEGGKYAPPEAPKLN